MTETRMTGAEFRMGMMEYGLTPRILADMLGWDERSLRRQATGEEPVAQETQDALADLADRIEDVIDELIEKKPEKLRIPRLGRYRAGLPSSVWHIIASAVQAEVGMPVEYRKN